MDVVGVWLQVIEAIVVDVVYYLFWDGLGRWRVVDVVV